MKKIFYK